MEQKVIWHEKHWELTCPLQCTLRICIFLFSLLGRMRPLYHIPETIQMIPNMTVNITCIHAEHSILLLTFLSELSEGKDAWGDGKG